MSGFFGLSFLASPKKLVENPGIDPGTCRSFFFVGLAAIAREDSKNTSNAPPQLISLLFRVCFNLHQLLFLPLVLTATNSN